MPKDSLYFRIAWHGRIYIASTLTKAIVKCSRLHDGMARRTFQENGVTGLRGVVAVQWPLLFCCILYIIMAPIVTDDR